MIASELIAILSQHPDWLVLVEREDDFGKSCQELDNVDADDGWIVFR